MASALEHHTIVRWAVKVRHTYNYVIIIHLIFKALLIMLCTINILFLSTQVKSAVLWGAMTQISLVYFRMFTRI